jgi:Outer membrane lipoprotein Slp family
MSSKLTFILLVLSCLSGCSSVPTALRGNFAEVTQAQASSPAFLGTEVRWGGVVVGARESNRGECLEIADFPLDTYYARPYAPDTFSHAALFRKDIVNYYLTESPRDSMPARFLACDAPQVNSKLDRVGAVLTVTGMIEPASVVQVMHDACTAPVARTMWQRNEHIPNYVGTEHVSDDGRCVVSLPTVQTQAIYAWKEPPGAPEFH